MPAVRKLDAIAVEQLVAARGAGRPLRQIAPTLGVSHSTLSRRIGREPELCVRISAAKKREARRARDRERKARAKAHRQAALQPDADREQDLRSRAGTAGGVERAARDQATRVVQDPAHSRTRPHGRRDELRAAGRIIRNLTAPLEAREAARETLLELLHATRSNGRPAYSLRLAAAKALMDDPARFAWSAELQLGTPA